MITTLLAGIVLWLDGCSACSLSGRNVFMCESHAAEERAAFQREAKHMSSKDEAERCMALEALAALTQAHPNAPSERVVDRIASVLDDSSLAVRTCATKLLGRPQHAIAALSALVDALERSAQDSERIAKEGEALRRKRETKLTDTRRAAIEADLQALGVRGKALREWRQVVVDQLATFPDDRAVTAICELEWGDKWVFFGEALVRLGSRSAMHALLESFGSWDVDLAKVERALADMKAKGLKTVAGALAAITLDENKAKATEMRLRMIALFAERGLVAPTVQENLLATWTSWYQQNLAHFPEHLPGVTSPAW